MTRDTNRRNWRWLRHVAWLLAAKIFLIVVGLAIFFGSGLGNPFLQRYLVRRIAAATGGKVELKGLSVRWLSLRATLKGLTIHGREPTGTEPLFAAEEIQAGLRVDSLWGRKVSLNDVLIKEPHVHIRVEKNGTSNLPSPAHTPKRNKPLRETLFNLHFHGVKLENGWILYNDVKSPAAVEGGDLRFGLDAGGTPEHPLYLGTVDWQAVHFTERRFLPVTANISAKFTLWRDGFTLEQGVINAGRSRFDTQVEMSSFTDPRWTFRYRGWLNLLDIRETFRSPLTPAGSVDVRGEGGFAGGQLRGTGEYFGHDITLSYNIFRAGGLTSRGSYHMDGRGLEVPDFSAQAFGGEVKGKVTLQFDGLQFRAVTHTQDVHLAPVLPDLERRDFPVNELHWDALISADTVSTWTGTFSHFEVAGQSDWSEPDALASGHIPVNAYWEFRYRHDLRTLNVESGEFDTPSSRTTISGVLAPRNTALDVKFDTGAIEAYNDFIHAVAGEAPGSAEAAKRVAGTVRWEGKITGPGGAPTFTGHARGERVSYDSLAFDSVEGDVTYSPQQLTLARGHLRRAGMETDLEGSLALTHWSFLPANAWSADANFEKIPIESLQPLLGWSYPASGLLTGQFHGRGTRDEPSVTGLFDLAAAKVYGVSFNRLRGQLNLLPDEVKIADAELRIFEPGKESGRGAGIVTGSAGYRFADRTISLDLVGAALPLENLEKLQSPRIPVGGQVSFRLRASGPALAPTADGTFRVVDLRVGQEVIGSFDGGLTSDGRIAKLDLGSAMSTGVISGGYTLGLADLYPIHGKVSITNIDLDPYLLTAMHLSDLTGHGRADGEIAVDGTLKQAEKIVLDAQFSRLLLTYAGVQLENVGPVHVRSSREELQIDPATFQGSNTNIQVGGAVRFSGRRAVNLNLTGALDLRLLGGYAPALDARGTAHINAAVEGTLDRPRVTGHVRVEDASARVAEFPAGLSAIKGDLIFDATRLFFENVTAEAGGGPLRFSGSVSYLERPLRYDITARSDRTRIRYPEGMSWLAGGALRLTGTPTAAVLSGRVSIDRVTLIQGIEVAGMLVSAKEGISGPATSSSFLRNLQFDVEAVSTPGARMEWPGAEFEAEANLRVRGTWEHPIILGHIHILSGNLSFHGNRYRVARGDLNFANPFRLDPVVNVEASTTIQQYEITLNFNGPASKLTLAYRSDPPLPANDIVTLLALGQTSSEAEVRGGGTGASQNATSGASAILSEAISSQLGGRLEKLFGITRFRVDPGLAGVGSTGSEQNAAARITVEQQVTRDLTITYVSNVSSTQQQVIQVEYNVNRNVSVVALRDQNGTFGIDIKIKKRFE